MLRPQKQQNKSSSKKHGSGLELRRVAFIRYWLNIVSSGVRRRDLIVHGANTPAPVAAMRVASQGAIIGSLEYRGGANLAGAPRPCPMTILR